MTSPEVGRRGDTEGGTIELPATEATQRALHEAIGHLYDELAIDCEYHDESVDLPDEVFDGIETLYVATAEESVSTIELTYELET